MLRLVVVFLMLLLSGASQAQAAKPAPPEKVTVGAHITDIQEIDLQTHSYRLDFYVWFRWRNPEMDPSKSFEFMNVFDPADHVRTPVYDKPQKMPDGSLYQIIREQGKFSAKFPLQKYPFDRQQLSVAMEDTVHAVDELVYVPDTKTPPISVSARIYLPGFNIGKPKVDVEAFPYQTNFGDLSQLENAAYSRAWFVLPVARPWFATGIKVFLPVALILFCAGLVFFVHPAYIEGRLGVSITALLTLVALQLTAASALPEVDYLLMTDKIYFLAYLFIIFSMLQVVRSSGLVHAHKYDAVRRGDRQALLALSLVFAAGTGAIILMTF
jgi:hypothetical protein